MKNFRLLLLSALGGLSLLAWSCDGDKLNDTDHPDKGKLRIITDWGTGVPATIPYIINYSLENSGNTQTIEARSMIEVTDLLRPGKYNIEVYSKDADTGFTLDGDVIQVDEDPANPGFIYANPSVFFSSRTSTIVYEDKVNVVRVPMLPQMRKLVVRVYLANDPLVYSWQSQAGAFREIDESSIKSTLTGASNRFNFIEDSYEGDYKVNLPFKVFRTPDNKSRYLQSVVTVVGFNSDENVAKDFSVEFAFKEGIQIPATTASFHDKLFNAEKNFNDYNQKRVNDTVSVEIVLPVSTSGTAYIQDYEPGNGGGEDMEVDENSFIYRLGDPYPMNSAVKEGVVVWVDDAMSLVPGEGSHGVVLSGVQSDLLAWGPTGEIMQLTGGVNPTLDKYNYRKYTTIYNTGVKNTSGIATYISTNKMRGATGYLEQEFEAYAWIKGSESDFSGYWFLPSMKELELLGDAATINGYLTANGFSEIDQILWSSQTEPELKPMSEWLFPSVPEYNMSWVYVRNVDGSIGKTYAVYPNPDFDINWVPDLVNFPDILVNPEPEFLPYKNYTRAMRFF